MRQAKFLAVSLCLVVSACSGSKPKPVYTQEGPKATAAAGDPTAVPSASGDAPAASAGSVATAPKVKGKGGTAVAVAPKGQAPTVTKDASGFPVANLFKPEEDKVGFTSDTIKICMHAAFALGAAFDNDPKDENVFFRMINANGGIFGRKVSVQFEDDKYLADEAINAATRCKDGGNFLILSGVGFDQIPRVRDWSETNRQLYFYSMATENGAADKQFSFAAAPTLQTVGRQVAQYILSAHPGKKIALLTRDSVNWDGAVDTFKAELAKKGVSLAGEFRVTNGQGSYATQLNSLKASCPASNCVVYANENVLNFVQIYQQASQQPQNYRPIWLNYGFQLTNDTIGASGANDPPIEAWYPTPAFDPTNSTNQPWWSEIQAMKAAYDEYCNGECSKPSAELNDVDWQFWVVFKSLTQLLTDCGKDCSRNRLVGMLLSGYKKTVAPLCDADYSRGNRHFGAQAANIFKAVRAPVKDKKGDPGAVWKNVATCQESF